MSHKMIHMAKFDKVVICCKVVSKTVETGVTLNVRLSVSLCYDNYLFINTVSSGHCEEWGICSSMLN